MLGQGSFMAIFGTVYLKINFTKGKSLLHRVLKTSIFYDITLVRFECDAEYTMRVKEKLK